jgi:hypothetical protein
MVLTMKMKTARLFLTVATLLFFWTVAFGQGTGCPPEGGPKPGRPALSSEKMEFNRKKNRPASEPGYTSAVISIDTLLKGTGAVHDRDTYPDTSYIELQGAYLLKFEEQGPEDCNCHLAASSRRNGDVHIVLCDESNLRAGNNNFTMVAEITPAYKALHPGYHESLDSLRGRRVTVRGYLFYDGEHERNSVNYCKTCSDKGVWRKTCWEVHPVTYIGPAVQ